MMNWTELLRSEVENNFAATDKLLGKVDENGLDWKPATGTNWMTMGQLLRHISEACGLAFKGFVTGDWEMPDGVDLSSVSPEEMLPPAEKMLSVSSVAEARQLLAEDHQTALDMLIKCGEERLATEPAPAPWDPSKIIMGQRLLHMVYHLGQHRSQLFYYLKLQGKQVHTGDLWG